MNNAVKVLWMYPDILNLHGERANAKAFELVAKKMNVELLIDRIDDIDANINFDDYDILLFNSGELKYIEKIKNSLYNQIDGLKKYIDDNKIILVCGTTGALFADNIYRTNNTSFKGLQILDMDVNERSTIHGDDIYFMFNDMKIIGSQIQTIDVNLKNVEPFGTIKYGYGNKGSFDEGAKYKNVIFTNCLGPILAKNPWFTEYLIKQVLINKGIKYDNNKILYNLEKKSLESTCEFIFTKLDK